MGRSVRRAVSVLAAGGILTGTLLVGAGVASAEEVCGGRGTIDSSGVVRDLTGDVVTTLDLDLLGLADLDCSLLPALPKQTQDNEPVEATVPEVVKSPEASVPKTTTTKPSATDNGDKSTGGGSTSGGSTGGGTGGTNLSGGTTGGGGSTPLASGSGAPNPAFGSAFSSLPSSFLGSAAPGGLSPAFGAGFGAFGSPYDAGMLFGSAFPAVRGDLPFAAGYDAGDSVTSASRVQALPGDGIGDGLGLPVVLAVLILSGMAAFATRHLVARRAAAAGRS